MAAYPGPEEKYTKKPKNRGFHHNFPATHKGYSSAVKFSIIGQSRHEKDLVFWFGRIWSDVRSC